MAMTQLHCKIETMDDGTVVAHSLEHNLVIRPVGEAKAFNRNFLRQKVNTDNLPGLLNNLAARINQGKISRPDAWEELRGLVGMKDAPDHDRWLVGELNGVRVYIQGNNYIMTTEDLYT